MNKPKEQPKLVQDRKTGEYYDPKAAFELRMHQKELLDMLKRLGKK